MRKILISLLVSLLATAPGPLAAATGSLSGRVLSASDRPAASRILVVPSGATAPLSAPVLTDGSFALAEVPAGHVDLAIETSEGLYTVNAPITIAPGATRTVQLALGGRQDTSDTAADSDAKQKKAGGVWANPLYATLIIVGSALVVGVLINQLTQPNDHPASPSTSTQ